MAHVPASASTRPARHDALRYRFAVGAVLITSLVSATVSWSDPVAGAPAAHYTPNLVKDPSFAHGLRAWTATSGARLSIVRHTVGRRAILVRNTTAHRKTIALNDRRNTIASTVAGRTYVASARIRVTKPRVSVAIRQGEWRGRALQGPVRLRSAWLTDTKWHSMSVTYRARTTGATIDFNVLAWKLPTGVAFEVAKPRVVAAGMPRRTTSSAKPRPRPTTTTHNPPSASVPPVTTTPPSDTSNGYRLVWNDEFTGSSVDTSKWHVRNDTWASNEQSIVTSRRDNVSVSDGVLSLSARNERYTAWRTTRDYTSGYLDTIGLHSQKYGRWVMRAKLPSAQGMWPAFWLRSDHSEGEIDILEAVGGLPNMTVQTAFPSTNDGKVKKSNAHTLPDGAGIDTWHVYGLTWTPDSISWDIDGATVFTLTPASASWVSTAFQDTMNIRLNLQVGGSMPGYFRKPVDSSTAFPAVFQVDYVRVYAK